MRPIDADVLIDIAEQQGHITVDDILNTPTIVSPPNLPLTLEELRDMDGEPVWIVEGSYSYWALITDVFSKALWIMRREDECEMLFDDYGKTWLAYRRKLEEGTV